MDKRYVLLFLLILTLPYIYTYADTAAVLELDKDVYEGVSDPMKITLTAPELNRDIRTAELVHAKVTASNSPFGIDIFLVETGINTGTFTNVVRFSFEASSAKVSIIKVAKDAVISVHCADLTADAVWKPYEAALGFKSEKYTGLGAVPEIVLTDLDLNTKPNEIEEIPVTVTSSSDTNGIAVILREHKADSGIFKGAFTLTATASNSKEQALHVEYNDTLTVVYTDNTSSKGLVSKCTDTAVWLPQTASIALDKSAYEGLNSKCKITVRDNDINLRKAVRDTTRVKVTSDRDSAGIYITLYETGTNTGVFAADLQFSKNASNEKWNTIKVGAVSNIKAAYEDAWNAANSRHTTVSAEAVFKFSKAALTITKGSGQSLNRSVTIIVKDADADLSGQKNTVPVNISSSVGSRAMTLWLEETGAASGSFKGTLFFGNENAVAKDTAKATIAVSPGDIISVEYNDTTVPEAEAALINESFSWEYQAAEVSFNKESYTGYNSTGEIIVKDFEANKDPKAVDIIAVKLSCTSMAEFTMILHETSVDSGTFKGSIYFGKQGNREKGILRVAPVDSLRLVYQDQGAYSLGAVEAWAVWQPSDAVLELDRREYVGNSAIVRITLKDMDIGRNSAAKNAVVLISVAGTPGKIRLPLAQTGNEGTFTGNLVINGSKNKHLSLKLKDGDVLEAIYIDEDNSDNKAVERRASAVWKVK